MSFTSTRESLLSLVDDLELISREMLENLIAPKARRMSAREHQELTDLLVAKDAELRSTLETARQQGRVQVEIEALRAEVARKDEAVRGLQMRLKEAEGILAASIYQAKQKLRAVDRAKDSPVSSEELIKYAHRISASNAVCAPLNWQQGDPRRPYPTDVEMRQGFLGRSEASAVAMDRSHIANVRPTMQQQQQQQQPTPSSSSQQATPTHQGDFGHNPSPFGGAHHSPTKAVPGGGGFSWQGGEMGMTMKDGSHIPIEGGGASGGGGDKQQDVEVMSTDSSSSSSTDSN